MSSSREGKEEMKGLGEGECGPQPRVSFGCGATLSKMIFPHPFFDLDMLSYKCIWQSTLK